MKYQSFPSTTSPWLNGSIAQQECEQLEAAVNTGASAVGVAPRLWASATLSDIDGSLVKLAAIRTSEEAFLEASPQGWEGNGGFFDLFEH